MLGRLRNPMVDRDGDGSGGGDGERGRKECGWVGGGVREETRRKVRENSLRKGRKDVTRCGRVVAVGCEPWLWRATLCTAGNDYPGFIRAAQSYSMKQRNIITPHRVSVQC